MPFFSSNIFLHEELSIDDASSLFLIFLMISWACQNLIRPDISSWKSFVISDFLKYLSSNIVCLILFFSLVNISNNSLISIMQCLKCCILLFTVQIIPRFIYSLYLSREKIFKFFDKKAENEIIIGSSDKIKSYLIQSPKTPNTYCINNSIAYGLTIFGIKCIGKIDEISPAIEYVKQNKRNINKVIYIKSDFSPKDQKIIELQLKNKKIQFNIF